MFPARLGINQEHTVINLVNNLMKRIMKSKSVKKLLIKVLFLLVSVPYMLAQGPVKVSGRITDDLKEPMIGVSIVEKGTTNGVMSDLDGNYSLSVKQGATVVFSYIGYVTQEKKALAGQMNIQLKEDSKTL